VNPSTAQAMVIVDELVRNDVRHVEFRERVPDEDIGGVTIPVDARQASVRNQIVFGNG